LPARDALVAVAVAAAVLADPAASAAAAACLVGTPSLASRCQFVAAAAVVAAGPATKGDAGLEYGGVAVDAGVQQRMKTVGASMRAPVVDAEFGCSLNSWSGC